ncbi:protein kinase domain-containing protein [Prosthecobacter sp.]|uniref:protein kinase domain-containing protein n=1 Tax=Prosthecobacter sp. TaxID=1965333 RepID=UPI0037831A5E
MPPAESATGMITLGPEDVTIAIPNIKQEKRDKVSTAQVAMHPPPAETPTGNVTLGPEDATIAIPNPSRALPAATMGASQPHARSDTSMITLGPEDQTIAIPTGKPATLPGAATLPSHGGLPAATASSMASMGSTSKPRSHMESLTGNDGWIADRYRLLDKLGEGGFGVVYRAEQVKPIHRIVAIKIVKAGVTSQDILGRFAIEQRTLAIMEHPNIARILDAGETDIGAPFFVMEMVKGRSITSYCKQNSLDLRQRLALFIPVCRAVHHAHQKGIIHRDIKPGNIMVMDEAGKAVPKVIDFGIAKVLEGEGSGHTIATGVDQLVGTPGYISPEQIENGSSHVDTRSDVYALGGVFFELICGRALITPADIAAKPIHVLLRDLAEKDPPKPSTIEPAVQGDLDWIALKALERDPNRRYGSADDLADDITRYLSFEPITARPPSRRYLITKFVRRHRVGVAAAIAISLAVLTGGITSTALYFEAERNRAEAELGREDLRKSFSHSDQQMARQFSERGQYNDAVAYLARSLRTDPANQLSSTYLLSLLANVHLIRPDTAPLSLPEGAVEAAKVAVSRETGTVLAASFLQPKTKPAASADESPERRQVISTWNIKTGERTDHPVPPGVEITCLDITPDGQQAVIARDDGNVELWTLNDGKRRTLQPRMPSLVSCIAFSGNGTKLLAGSEIDAAGMGSIHLWDLRKPQDPAVVMKQKGVVGEIAVDNDGVFATSIYSGDPIDPEGPDGTATTWDLRLGQAVGDPIEVDKGLLHVAIEPTQELVALGTQKGEVFVGSFRNGGEVLTPIAHPSAITSLAFTADSRSIVVGDGGGYVHIWNLSDGKLRFPTRPHDGEILTAMPAVDTSLIATVSRHGDVSVFDIQTGALLSSHIDYAVKDAKITRDGSFLALAPLGSPFVQVWDIHERMAGRKFVDILDKNLITRIKGPDNSPQQLRDSEAGGANRQKSLYAAADPDGTVYIYDAKTLKPIGKPILHPPAVGAVTITQDEKLLITSGRDRAVRIWDIATRQNIQTLSHKITVPVIALSPDDQRLVTVSDDGELRVWEIRTGECLTPGIRDTPRANSDEQGIVVARVSDDGRSVLFRVSGHGFFSADMPPQNVSLPEWFLRLAEGLARRHLTAEGNIKDVSLEDYESAVASIPKKPAKGEETALSWATWLLAPPSTRPISPLQKLPFEDYLKSLKDNGSPAAARELLRYRPKDKDAADRSKLLVPSLPK